jgi:hypothetical protein
MSTQYSDKSGIYPSNSPTTTANTISKTPFLIEDILYINNNSQSMNKNVSDKNSVKYGVNSIKNSGNDSEDIRKNFLVER